MTAIWVREAGRLDCRSTPSAPHGLKAHDTHPKQHAKIAGFAGIISKHLKENYHGNQAEEKKPPSGVWP